MIKDAIAFAVAILISKSISCILNLGKMSLYKVIIETLLISSSWVNIGNKCEQASIAAVLTL